MASSHRSTRWRTAATAFGASALAFGVSFTLLGPGVSTASSHREAPLIVSDPLADNTDTYAFVSPDAPDTTTLIANWIPFQEPSGGPNFYPWATGDNARYNIKIDNNGDAEPDITYQWTFTNIDLRGDVPYPPEDQPNDGTFLYNNGAVSSIDDENLLFRQTYTLERITADGSEAIVTDAPVAPSHVGDASMPDYQTLRNQSVVSTSEGGTSFAGQADDPFFLDLRVFDLLYGGDLSEVGFDSLCGYNVNSVALQVPTSELVAGEDPVIGVWSTTDRPSTRVLAGPEGLGAVSYEGDFVQVSRLGNPLVNELVVPADLKDAFNSLPPSADATVPDVVARVLYPELPKVVESIYGIPAPEEPRNDLQAIFLTGLAGLNQPASVTPSEQLRLNTSIPPSDDPNRLGVLAGDNAGFPNGRRLVDDVVDIEIQAVEGAVSVDEMGAPTGVEIVQPLAAGDAVNANDREFGSSFPYLALPHSGSQTTQGCGGPATQPPPDNGGGGGGGGDQPQAEMPLADTGVESWLPMSAAGLGLGFAILGVALLRRRPAADGS